MVFNTTFNNISVISWLSVLLVEEIGVPRENQRSVNLDYFCVKEGDCPEKSYCHINFHKCCKEGMSSLILLMYLMNCRKFWACLTIEGQRSTWLLPGVICF
jgi:hypothetical protein